MDAPSPHFFLSVTIDGKFSIFEYEKDAKRQNSLWDTSELVFQEETHGQTMPTFLFDVRGIVFTKGTANVNSLLRTAQRIDKERPESETEVLATRLQQYGYMSSETKVT